MTTICVTTARVPHASHPARAVRPIRSLGRPVRVGILVLAICAMSLADLAMTLTYLLEVGMIESNPFARAIMLYNSPALLVAWKLATVALGAAIIIAARRTRIGEMGAWFIAAVLVALTIRWSHYNAAAHTLTPYLEVMTEAPESQWVAMVP